MSKNKKFRKKNTQAKKWINFEKIVKVFFASKVFFTKSYVKIREGSNSNKQVTLKQRLTKWNWLNKKVWLQKKLWLFLKVFFIHFFACVFFFSKFFIFAHIFLHQFFQEMMKTKSNQRKFVISFTLECSWYICCCR